MKLSVLVIVGMIVLSGYLLYQLNQPPKPLIVPTVGRTRPPLINLLAKPSKSGGLEKVVTDSMSGAQGKYAIVIKNLKTGEGYTQLEHEIIPTGSLYKLWVMSQVYSQLKNDKIQPDDILTASIPDLNSQYGLSDDVADLTDGQITLTVSQALEQMITISHNYSAMLLESKVGAGNIAQDLKNYDLVESKIGSDPKTTAYDVALFFQLLHDGKIVDASTSAQMINLLSRQQRNDAIPKYLPPGVMVAHKTGEIDYFKHDAGIISSPETGDYIFVVLSKSDSPYGAEERIALLSKAVYEYFSTKK